MPKTASIWRRTSTAHSHCSRERANVFMAPA